jgi:hypothetical protein
MASIDLSVLQAARAEKLAADVALAARTKLLAAVSKFRRGEGRTSRRPMIATSTAIGSPPALDLDELVEELPIAAASIFVDRLAPRFKP